MCYLKTCVTHGSKTCVSYGSRTCVSHGLKTCVSPGYKVREKSEPHVGVSAEARLRRTTELRRQTLSLRRTTELRRQGLSLLRTRVPRHQILVLPDVVEVHQHAPQRTSPIAGDWIRKKAVDFVGAVKRNRLPFFQGGTCLQEYSTKTVKPSVSLGQNV